MTLPPTPGLVLGARPYLEADKLVQLYTRQFGKLRARVRGARKPKSRLGASLELFTESTFTLSKGPSAELYLITQAKLTRGFPRLKQDFATITLLQVMAEILSQALPDGEPEEGLYGLVLGTLGHLEAHPEDREILVGGFLVRLLERLGHPLELDRCAGCGNPLGASGAFLIAHRGGALGPECFPSGPGPLRASPSQLGWLRQIRALPPDRLAALGVEKARAREILVLLLAYLERILEKPLRTLDYYRSVLPA